MADAPLVSRPSWRTGGNTANTTPMTSSIKPVFVVPRGEWTRQGVTASGTGEPLHRSASLMAPARSCS